jgi:hypothetical protein
MIMTKLSDSFYYKAMSVLKPFCPAAGRAVSRMNAKDAFSLATDRGLTRMAPRAAEISRDMLAEAGYDVETDKPYREVLGLKGGKAEFDAKFPTIRPVSADAPAGFKR